MLKLKLKYYRDKAGLTQEDLARDAHVSISTIQSIEADRRSASLDTLYKIANVLGVTVNDLLFVYDNTNSTNFAEEVS